MKNYNSIPRNGLVGEWLLDGNALDTNDGTKNNGTATNVTYVKTTKGYQAQAGSFNGSSSVVGISNTPAFKGISFFVNALGFDAVYLKYIFSGVNCGQSTSNTNDFYIAVDNDGNRKIYTFVNDNVMSKTVLIDTRTALIPGTFRHIYIELDGVNLKQYENGILVYHMIHGLSYQINIANNNLGKHITAGTPHYFNGNIQSVRLYNRVLSQSEITNLYLEGLRKLGGGGDDILSSCVAQFENYGDNNLENITSGIVATRTGGTSTTDNFGISKAITNPNYTWSSITYTTGYTFEDDGTGWAIKTSPTGLSATGINRTTTLRSIFLMNRTLSASEVTALENLCKIKYLYPIKKTFPLNLNDGKVLHLAGDTSGTTALDVSGNSNNGTLVNSPTITRVGQHKVFGLGNDVNKYIGLGTSLGNGYTALTYSCWIYQTGTTNIIQILFGDDSNLATFAWKLKDSTGGRNVIINTTSGNQYGTALAPRITNKWIHYVGTWSAASNTLSFYVNGALFSSVSTTGTSVYNSSYNKYVGYSQYYGATRAFQGSVKDCIVWNKVLTPAEIQQLYYSTYIQ